ncbi:MAG: flagellar hook-length control protein FliK [Pseudomonadota bacterium]
MEEVNLLNLPPGPAEQSTGGKNQTPQDIGQELFGNILAKLGRSSSDSAQDASLYQEEGGSPNPSGRGGNALDSILGGLEHLSLPMGQLRLPEQDIPRLVRYLENQGLDHARIDRMIQAAKGPGGSIHMDRFMASLRSSEREKQGPGNGLLIASKDLPRLEELLFRIGLGAGEVKSVIESSMNRGGDIVADRLSGALARFLKDTDRAREIVSSLHQFDIRMKKESPEGKLIDPELKNALTHFSETGSQDLQKVMKQNIAALLKERGIPPQEIKSFLETMTVDYAKTLLNKADAASGRPKGQEASADLLNRVVIRKQPEWHKGGWHEKILDVLKQENLIAEKDLDLERLKGEGPLKQGEGPLRLRVAELLRQAGEGQQRPGIGPSMVKETGGPAEKEGLRQRAAGVQDAGVKKLSHGSMETRDITGGQAAGISRTERNLFEAGMGSQGRNAAALPDPLPRIMDRMMWMIRSGEQRGRIHISPPELGRLDLDLVIRQGHLHANLSAENQAVKELIEANLNQLKQQLSDQGFIVERFDVMVGLQDYRNQDAEGRMSSGGKGRPRKKTAAVEEVPKAESGVLTGTRTGLYEIDVHV